MSNDVLAQQRRALSLTPATIGRAVRRSSPSPDLIRGLRGEGHAARRKTRTRPGEGAFPQAQTRGEAPSSRPSPWPVAEHQGVYARLRGLCRKRPDGARGEGDRPAPGAGAKQATESEQSSVASTPRFGRKGQAGLAYTAWFRGGPTASWRGSGGQHGSQVRIIAWLPRYDISWVILAGESVVVQNQDSAR
jgi:hypothetical protein